MPEPEVLGRDQQVFQRAPHADVELAAGWIGDGLAPVQVGDQVYPVVLHRESPGLAVLDRGRQDGVPEQEAKLRLDGPGLREVLF
jgi:hypothetical protein